MTRLRGRLVKVALFSGLEILGRPEEASRFELVLGAPNGRRVRWSTFNGRSYVDARVF